MRRAVAIALSLASLAGAARAADAPLLAGLFQDHGVLQRDRPIPVWGHAAPGERISVELAGRAASAQADGQGRWRVELPAMSAGGPYALTARGEHGESQTASDLLVGDVWLCAGQSNMQLQTRWTASFGVIDGADNPNIRLLTVDDVDSRTPRDEFARAEPWQLAFAKTVPDFSAACWYFASELAKTVKAPLGLINASWGGSAIEAWLKPDTAQRLGLADQVELLQLSTRDPAAATQRWGRTIEEWWRAKNPGASPPWSAAAGAGWRAAPAELTNWERWGVPELADFDGVVWYRTTITLTPGEARSTATLKLGIVDDVDNTWVNGEPVGSTSGAGVQRSYHLRPGLLRAGKNTIVVMDQDLWGTGGMYGPPPGLIVDDMIKPLGGWSYRIEPKAHGSPPRAPWDALAGVSVIEQGMLEPMGAYPFKGAIWYQGESNTDHPSNYTALLGGLASDLRRAHGADLPFLVVQLPDYGARAAKPGPSGWAELREQQRRAVAADPRAALAVTIDIGDLWDIHPRQKTEVGRRLALAAGRLAYSDAKPATGPTPISVERRSGTVRVRFGEIQGQLHAYSGDHVLGFELCDAPDRDCRYADAVLDGDTVVLTVPPEASAKLVRLGWADSPILNLFDDSGRPAGPFELPVP